MTKKLLFTFVLLGLAFLTGCSNKQQRLTGTVTFSDDGTPVPTGSMLFLSETVVARATIENGQYTVSTMGHNDGIPIGHTFVVTITAEEIRTVQHPDGVTREMPTSIIDPKYMDERTSGLSFTTDGTNRTFDIQVDRASRR